MKKITTLILMLITIFSLQIFTMPYSVQADDAQYILIDNTNNEFYEKLANNVGAITSILPNTYYAKYISTTADNLYQIVEYNGIEGLIKKTNEPRTYPSDITKVSPYYECTTILNTDVQLYTLSRSNTIEISNIDKDLTTIVYIGTIEQEQNKFIQIKYTNTNNFYYLKLSDHRMLATEINNIEPHISAITPPPIIDDKPTTNDPSENGLTRILLIVGISIASIVLLIILFRPSQKKESKQ